MRLLGRGEGEKASKYLLPEKSNVWVRMGNACFRPFLKLWGPIKPPSRRNRDPLMDFKTKFSLSFLSTVRELQQGLLETGEPQNPSEVAHRREALHLRVPGLHKGLLKRFGQGQASEQDTF